MQHIRSDKHQTTSWAGGTTTELFIWPEHTSYENRDFAFRLSTATVEVPTSTFTALPGVHRRLMVLEGSMFLEHEGHHNCQLRPFETDVFEGGWTTHSKGKCKDLNLMCRGTAAGSMRHFSMFGQEVKKFELKGIFDLFYLFKGSITLGSFEAKTGDLIVLKDAISTKLRANEVVECIHIEMQQL